MKEGHFLLVHGQEERVSWKTFKALKRELNHFLPPFIVWNEEKTPIKVYGYTAKDFERVSDPWKITPEQRRTLFQVCSIILQEELHLKSFEPVFCVQRGSLYIIPQSFSFDGNELNTSAFCRLASFLCLNKEFKTLEAAHAFVNYEEEKDPRIEKFAKRLQTHGFIDNEGQPKWRKLSDAALEMQRRTNEALDACRMELRRFAGAVTNEFSHHLQSARSQYETPPIVLSSSEESSSSSI